MRPEDFFTITFNEVLESGVATRNIFSVHNSVRGQRASLGMN